ncbi:MAG: hypothetical protein CSB55_04895 [Candidatus Cloacimonadota bacterium]|nr:MAG: hypothetical protein CSB55_04895 [Candidatus Cloacimonadota bacterium]
MKFAILGALIIIILNLLFGDASVLSVFGDYATELLIFKWGLIAGSSIYALYILINLLITYFHFQEYPPEMLICDEENEDERKEKDDENDESATEIL